MVRIFIELWKEIMCFIHHGETRFGLIEKNKISLLRCEDDEFEWSSCNDELGYNFGHGGDWVNKDNAFDTLIECIHYRALSRITTEKAGETVLWFALGHQGYGYPYKKINLKLRTMRFVRNCLNKERNHFLIKQSPSFGFNNELQNPNEKFTGIIIIDDPKPLPLSNSKNQLMELIPSEIGADKKDFSEEELSVLLTIGKGMYWCKEFDKAARVLAKKINDEFELIKSQNK